MDRATGIFVEGMGAAAATSGVLTQLQGRIFALLYLHQRLATVVSAVGWIVLVGEGRSGMAAFTSSPSRWASLAPSSRSRDDDEPGTRQPDLRWRLCLLPAMGGAPAPLRRGGLLEMVPYQSLDLERRFPAVSRGDCARRVYLVDACGVVYRGAAAAPEALRRLPGGCLWSLPFGLPGGLTVAERVYDWVAYRFGPLDHVAAGGRDREVAETPTLLNTLMPAFDFGRRHERVLPRLRLTARLHGEASREDERGRGTQ